MMALSKRGAKEGEGVGEKKKKKGGEREGREAAAGCILKCTEIDIF